MSDVKKFKGEEVVFISETRDGFYLITTERIFILKSDGYSEIKQK
jgi:hypothetical protein